MVTMGVGNQDTRDLFLGEARQQGRDMLLELRPGIDDRDLALADDIGAGALEGERAGVARDNAPDPWRKRFEPALFEGDLAAKRNVDSHGGFAPG